MAVYTALVTKLAKLNRPHEIALTGHIGTASRSRRRVLTAVHWRRARQEHRVDVRTTIDEDSVHRDEKFAVGVREGYPVSAAAEFDLDTFDARDANGWARGGVGYEDDIEAGSSFEGVGIGDAAADDIEETIAV